MQTPDEWLEQNSENLGVYRGPDFLALPLPERTSLLGPWLVEQSLTTIYADRGLGKSMLMMGMGLAVAKGEPFLGYPAGPASTVLYLDGEMAPREFQKRIEYLAGEKVPENFYAISAPYAQDEWADLNDPYGQTVLNDIINNLKPKLVILDNKSTLFPHAKENEAQSWTDIQRWFIALRKQGLAVVLVHHEGKNGKQRGTSLLDVTLDTSIHLLKPPMDSLGEYGARFVLTFDKNRHFYGDDTKPMLVELSAIEGKAYWNCQPYKGNPQTTERDATIRQLAVEGLSQRAIAEKVGVGLATVNRALAAGH